VCSFVVGLRQVDPKAVKEIEKIMKGYHDFAERGRREIYKIET
jgi:hypothetical protein